MSQYVTRIMTDEVSTNILDSFYYICMYGSNQGLRITVNSLQLTTKRNMKRS